MRPLPAEQALDRYFLEARSRLLDLAAILDRIDRGTNTGDSLRDSRIEKINKALELLRDEGPDRAERIQRLFSLDYDAAWERPKPR